MLLNKNKFIFILCIILFVLAPLFSQGKPSAPGGKTEKSSSEEKGVRLKDLARISGIRTNQLIGYGLVVGLPGSGDTRSVLAAQSMQNLLTSMGQKLDGNMINARNIAAVLVTAELPPFARRGDRVNVTVSSIGDAKSLQGGVLVQTPLYGGNSQIYGISQGVVTTGSSADENTRISGNKTVGSVLSGGHVEKPVDSSYMENRMIRISLNFFDFATLNLVREKITSTFSGADLKVEGGSIILGVPEKMEPVEFISKLEEIRIEPNSRARVVINERTGTIVMGGDIHVDPVAVTRGGMQLVVTGKNQKSPDTMGIHVPVIMGDKKGDENKNEATKELKAASVQEIISALNHMGATVKDVIAILQALKDSGALHAELIVI